MLRIMTVIFSLLFLTLQSVQAKRIEAFFTMGSHTVLNNLKPHPGIAGYVGGGLIYNLTATHAIGVRIGVAAYKLHTEDVEALLASTLNNPETWRWVSIDDDFLDDELRAVNEDLAQIVALGTEPWGLMGDIFATYRLQLAPGKSTRIYIELGLGISDPIPLYDTGFRLTSSTALLVATPVIAVFPEVAAEATATLYYDEMPIRFASTAALGVKRFIGDQFSLGVEVRGVAFTQKEGFLSTKNVTLGIHEISLVLGYLFDL